ncbi:MAG: hypothetical protein FWB80_10820 [Defluviitaleaceae bacterium]|nr:hypothetical protein [Defluviitaleaceae bacterium]
MIYVLNRHGACRVAGETGQSAGDAKRSNERKRGEGCVICMADDVLPISAIDRAVGVRYL